MSASIHPPTPPADPRKESLIEYPSRFPIKVMGAKVDGFVHAVTTIARQFDLEFDASSVELRDSSAGQRLRAIQEDKEFLKQLFPEK